MLTCLRRLPIPTLVAFLLLACAGTSTNPEPTPSNATEKVFVQVLALEADVDDIEGLATQSFPTITSMVHRPMVSSHMLVSNGETATMIASQREDAQATDASLVCELTIIPRIQHESIEMSVDVQLCEDNTPVFTTVRVSDGQRIILPLEVNRENRRLTLVLQAEIVRTRQDLEAIMSQKKQEAQH